MNAAKKTLFFIGLFSVLLMAYLVVAATKDYVSVDVINTSSNGFTISSTNGLTVNGSNPFLVNTSKIININISLIRNGTHGNYVNITFGWQLKANGSYMLNTTLFNNTLNQSAFNYSFNSLLLPDGFYNISIFVENVTTDVASNNVNGVVNFSRGFEIVVDNVAPPIGSFGMNITNNTNLTGNLKIIITAGVNDTVFTQAVRIGVTNTFLNGTEFNISLVTKNFSLFAAEIDTAFMTDGIYTLAVYANDSLKNNNVTIANLSFTLDRTGPNVTNIFLGNYTNGANFSAVMASTTGNFILNITAEVNDSLSSRPTTVNRLDYVRFNITNSTGQINFTVASPNGSLWNATIAVNISDSRYFPDGVYSIIVYANDSLNNFNRTQNLTFTIDRTLPSVSVACSPSDATAGQTVTCTCTRSDGGTGIVAASSGFSGSATTESTTAAGSGTFTSSTCSASDYAGNTKTATGSWTVAAASSGGGGGSGSSGGSASGVTGVFEKKTWTSINAGETATVPVANGAIGVTEVSFAVSKTTYGAWVQVKKIDSLPSSVEAFDRKVYRTVDMTQNNVDKVLQGVATIKFKVEKAWLTDNKVKKEDVSLFHYVGGSWTELTTASAEDDGTYVHYSAQTPGFSYFVIGQKKEVAAAAVGSTSGKETPAVEEAAAMAEGTAKEAVAMPQPVPVKGKVPVWIVLFVIAVVLLAVLYYYWKKK